MPELRKDPIVGRWVIIATNRAKRPVAPRVDEPVTPGTLCPFCAGQEDVLVAHVTGTYALPG